MRPAGPLRSAEGYRNLCRLITRMKLRAPKGEGALTLEELEGRHGGLVALAGRAALEPGGSASAGSSIASSASSAAIAPTSSCSAITAATKKTDNRTLVGDGRGLPGAGHRDRRRPVRDAGRRARCSTC